MATEPRRELDCDDHIRLLDGGKRHEILDGEHCVTLAPGPIHQRVSRRLQRKLEDSFEARGWIVDLTARSIACPRLAGDAYRWAVTAEGDALLTCAEWPEPAIPLADLWR